MGADNGEGPPNRRALIKEYDKNIQLECAAVVNVDEAGAAAAASCRCPWRLTFTSHLAGVAHSARWARHADLGQNGRRPPADRWGRAASWPSSPGRRQARPS